MSKQERQPFFMSVINLGTPEFPRYGIADHQLRYWNGDGWTKPEADSGARVYATENAATEVMYGIMTQDHQHLPKKTYVVPVYIEVFSDTDIPLRDPKWLLFRTTKVIVDSPRHGNGPVEGSLGTVRIEYSEMTEATS